MFWARNCPNFGRFDYSDCFQNFEKVPKKAQMAKIKVPKESISTGDNKHVFAYSGPQFGSTKIKFG